MPHKYKVVLRGPMPADLGKKLAQLQSVAIKEAAHGANRKAAKEVTENGSNHRSR